MLLCLLHSHLTPPSSSFQHIHFDGKCLGSSSRRTLFLPPSLVSIPSSLRGPHLRPFHGGRSAGVTSSLIEAPVLWAGRLCIFYALLKTGLAGSDSNPFVPSGTVFKHFGCPVNRDSGCQIRRESAHGESVCCNNVRALFDELPTPHLVVEITAFPAGPLTDKDYIKAEKLERVLRSGSSI
ncbi:hypothetical protein BHE74_00052920 [Ensete ventricosum]|uniref:Uncharacterized protein n=1 Tax=Ensete ventricosum TaxID=4639 RepID=A0A426Y9M2_ENSVE|nr:hypothetical protein B296_00046823 [Ensete ventricosum]RWW41595.1 hypothetical protein BHE74_00052920 [Ensete ventricosum]RZR72545.1 hypothetical protein BHM03_00014483 [Ensete ventricosum]